MPLLLSWAPTNRVTVTSPEGKDMVGGGRGGPVVFPHPDDDDAGRLLDNVGSTNTNDDNNDDTPPPPPENDCDAPRGEEGRDGDGAGRRRDGVAASRDAVATNAKNATNEIGSRRARNLRAAAETW